MARIKGTAALRTCLIGMLLLGAASCSPGNPITGKWRSEGPAQLVFEYRLDGSVHLLADSGDYQVFRYQILDGQKLRLFDGMGRIRQYRFEVEGERLIYYDDANPQLVREQYRRE